MLESYTWGKTDSKAAQGWMYRRIDRRYWSAAWSDFWNTLERDGPQTFREDGSRRSENGRIVSFPQAVMDDFGFLVPIPIGFVIKEG